jgi:response regulator NasT
VLNGPDMREALQEGGVLEKTKSRRRLRVLLVDDSEQRRQMVAQSLAEVACEIVGRAASHDDLSMRVQHDRPDVVVIATDSPSRDTLEGLESLRSTAPRPVVMFTRDEDGETITRATRAGVSAYVVDGLSQKRVRPILDAAIERFQEFSRLNDELAKTRAQLAERKVVDKAKSLLMNRRGMSEDEAYRALRDLAMRNNKRIAEIAEGVVATAKLLG